MWPETSAQSLLWRNRANDEDGNMQYFPKSISSKEWPKLLVKYAICSATCKYSGRQGRRRWLICVCQGHGT
jgi:hypothetical protein